MAKMGSAAGKAKAPLPARNMSTRAPPGAQPAGSPPRAAGTPRAGTARYRRRFRFGAARGP